MEDVINRSDESKEAWALFDALKRYQDAQDRVDWNLDPFNPCPPPSKIMRDEQELRDAQDQLRIAESRAAIATGSFYSPR